jgi:polyisoprenoid-binding protein YceI
MKLLFILSSVLFSFITMAANQVTVFVELTPAGSFTAVSKKVKGNLRAQGDNFSAEKISVTVESFKTGIDLRDEHFWKHLQSSKASTASKISLTDLKATGGKGTATIEVNGIKKPVVISYTTKGSEVLAKFSLKSSDFKLAKAEYLGVGVDDMVKIETTIGFRSK